MSNKFIVKFSPFDKVEHIEHVQFVSTLSKGRNFVRQCFIRQCCWCGLGFRIIRSV